ncbi:MAG: hypothetical protein V4726_07305 [Verrucomicrobiota bacterium]
MDPAIFYSLARRRDSRHGTSVLQFNAWQGAPVTWRIGVLKEDGTLDNMAGVSAIRLLVSTSGGTRPGTDSWIDRSVAAADFTVPASAQAVRDETGWHAEFELAEGVLQLPVDVSGERVYWYEFRTAEGIVLAAGEMVVRARTGDPVDRYVTEGDVTAAVDAEADLREAADNALASSATALAGAVTAQAGTISALQAASAGHGSAIAAQQAELDNQGEDIDGLITSANLQAVAIGDLEEDFSGLANSAHITASATPSPGQIPLIGSDGKLPASALPPTGLIVFGEPVIEAGALRVTTTTATPAVLTFSGGGGIAVSPHGTAHLLAQVTARSEGGARVKMWDVRAGIKCGTGAASATLVGTPGVDVTAADTGTESWSIAVTAVAGDADSPGRLAVTVTGEAAKTILWTAGCWLTKLTGTATDDDGTGPAAIYGVPTTGAVLTSSGDFGYYFTGTDWPGYTKTSFANTEWKIDGVGTGNFDPTFICPTMTPGNQVKRGPSNTLTTP